MNFQRLAVRLRERPDSLERASGLLRRKGFAVQRVSASFVGHGAIELVICIDGSRTDLERVCRELMTLRDVTHIASIPAQSETREFLLARLRPVMDQTLPVARSGVLEMIGSPGEIDEVLHRLHAQDAISDFVRSGEVAVPKAPPTQEEDEE